MIQRNIFKGYIRSRFNLISHSQRLTVLQKVLSTQFHINMTQAKLWISSYRSPYKTTMHLILPMIHLAAVFILLDAHPSMLWQQRFHRQRSALPFFKGDQGVVLPFQMGNLKLLLLNRRKRKIMDEKSPAFLQHMLQMEMSDESLPFSMFKSDNREKRANQEY